jgi:ABC-type polysaccharide/polyol phosphate export permease
MIVDNIKNHRYYLNFKKYRYLLYEFIKRDIKLQYRRSFFGVFWTFLNPLFYTIVLTVVFSTFFTRTIENYPVYLVIGKLLFDFFAKGTRSALGAFKSAANITKVYIPKYIYPLSQILGAFIMFWISVAVLILLILVTGVQLKLTMFFIIVPIFVLFLFVLGLGLTFSTINVFFRDMQFVWGVLLTIFMWTSAIFYPASIIPAKFQPIVQLNPLFIVIDSCRDAILYNTISEFGPLLYVTILGLVLLVIGILLMYKYQDKYVLHI